MSDKLRPFRQSLAEAQNSRIYEMVKLRLKREGNKGRPYYRIVAVDSRARRDGRYIQSLGNYDPLKESDNFDVDLESVDKWIGNGAQMSDTVRSLVKKARDSAEASS